MRSNFSKLFVIGLVLAVVVNISILAAGQEGTRQMMYNISGNVFDQENSDPIDGASVEIINQNTQESWFVGTDGSGHYSMSVEPGSYRILVDTYGYNPDDKYVEVVDWDVNVDDFMLNSDGSTNGGSNGDGGDNGDGEDFDLFGDDGFGQIFMYGIILVITFLVLLMITAFGTIAMVMRLGKIKKELIKMNEKIEEKHSQRPAAPAQSPPVEQDYPPEPPAE